MFSRFVGYFFKHLLSTFLETFELGNASFPQIPYLKVSIAAINLCFKEGGMYPPVSA